MRLTTPFVYGYPHCCRAVFDPVSAVKPKVSLKSLPLSALKGKSLVSGSGEKRSRAETHFDCTAGEQDLLPAEVVGEVRRRLSTSVACATVLSPESRPSEGDGGRKSIPSISPHPAQLRYLPPILGSRQMR
jgi:hypothetical protein